MQCEVFVGIPMYDGRLTFGCAEGLGFASSKRKIGIDPNESSLIPKSCNRLLAKARNVRAKWFALLHSDIAPEPWWLDKLLDEADRVGADFLSVVVPIKGAEGFTSTAIAAPGDVFGCFCHLTQEQVRHREFPDTFGIEEAAAALERLPVELRVENVPRDAMLCNTGCMVLRIDRPWSKDVWFQSDDQIIERNGEAVAVSQSEDWHLSRRVAALGGKVMATRLVRLKHRGFMDFDSYEEWGQPRSVP